MKKFSTALLILFLSTLILASFTACDKLKITNLKANKHFKSGNKFYTEEKYKKAITEYEAALQLNPDLKAAFYYLGSSYIMTYKPGDDSEKNKESGAKAVEYLTKALEQSPEDKNIIQALGDINDKMSNFEEAEKYYLQAQKFTPDDPASYFTLAGFYNNNGKYDKAIEMYEKRIELDPENPEGYLYLADFFQTKRKWDDAIKNHELRIQKLSDADLDEKEKNEILAEGYYRLGVVLWNKAYQTPPDIMGAVERLQVVEQGMNALGKATELSPNYPDPWAYMGLLYKQKQIAEPLKAGEYEKQYKTVIEKFQELRKRKVATEQFIKDLAKEK